MTQRTRFTLYLVIVHLLLAAAGALLLRQYPLWLFALEAGFVMSAAVGIGLPVEAHGVQFLHLQKILNQKILKN